MPQLADHDLANINESGKNAPSLAESASMALQSMVEKRRRQEEAWMRRYEELSAIIQGLRNELGASRRELTEVLHENDMLKKNSVILMQNHRRLYLGFVSLLKAVEDACGADVAVDQRIEATLLSADMGSLLGQPADVSTKQARDFLAFTEASRMPFSTENYDHA